MALQRCYQKIIRAQGWNKDFKRGGAKRDNYATNKSDNWYIDATIVCEECLACADLGMTACMPPTPHYNFFANLA